MLISGRSVQFNAKSRNPDRRWWQFWKPRFRPMNVSEPSALALLAALDEMQRDANAANENALALWRSTWRTTTEA